MPTNHRDARNHIFSYLGSTSDRWLNRQLLLAISEEAGFTNQELECVNDDHAGAEARDHQVVVGSSSPDAKAGAEDSQKVSPWARKVGAVCQRWQ